MTWPDRNGPVVRALRRPYGVALQAIYGRRGLPWRVNGEQFRIDPRVRRYVPHENEPDLFAFLREHVCPGDVVFDVGSFLGVYAMLEARRAGATGRVLAFEPSPWTIPFLLRHVHMNGLDSVIDARQAAVGASRGARTLRAFDDEPYRNTLAAVAGGPTVEVVTIDDMCDVIGRPPDWIRMDVQGLEFDVLRGARRTLRAASRLRIVAEMHPQEWPEHGVTRGDVPDLLAGLGLRARSLTGAADPFTQDAHALLERV